MPSTSRSAARRTRGLAIALAGLAGVAVIAFGCGRDRADRAYFDALRGEETSMTREQQVALLSEAIALSPRRAYYYETRAIYLIDLKRFDLARRDLDRDIELTDRPYARFMRGLVACQSGQYAGSLADFDAAIARQPDNTQFYRGRSLARAAVGDAVGALQDAEHLVDSVPQQAESYYARGVASVLLGHVREAIADFDRAAAIRPELVYVVEARAQALERIGDRAGARRDRDAIPALRVEHGGCAPCLDPFRY
jgi:tetratricopeptide (TPR) repeat protein